MIIASRHSQVQTLMWETRHRRPLFLQRRVDSNENREVVGGLIYKNSTWSLNVVRPCIGRYHFEYTFIHKRILLLVAFLGDGLSSLLTSATTPLSYSLTTKSQSVIIPKRPSN